MMTPYHLTKQYQKQTVNYEAIDHICVTVAQWLNTADITDPGWSTETWQQFRLVCQAHGVAPFRHKKLEQATWLDPEIRTWLTQSYTFNRARVARLRDDLKAILVAFKRQGVPYFTPERGDFILILWPRLRISTNG